MPRIFATGMNYGQSLTNAMIDTGMAYLKTAVIKNHGDIRIEYPFPWGTDEEVLSQMMSSIRDYRPDAVLVKEYLNTPGRVNEFLATVREYDPTIKLVKFGPEVNSFESLVLFDKDGRVTADAAVRGGAFQTIPYLLQWIAGEIGVDEVPGSIYIRPNGEPVENEQLFDGADIPSPDFSGLPLDRLWSLVFWGSAFGCPWGLCNFCEHTVNSGHYRTKSPEIIGRELNGLKELGIKCISLTQSMIRPNNLPPRLGIPYGGFISCNPTLYDTQLIDRMAEVGIETVFAGLESGSRDVRNWLGKTPTENDDILDMMVRLMKRIPAVGLSFIIPPYKPMESIQESVKIVKRLSEETGRIIPYVAFSALAVFPKSSFGREPGKHGLSLKRDWEKRLMHGLSGFSLSKTSEERVVPPVYEGFGYKDQDLYKLVGKIREELGPYVGMTESSHDDWLLGRILAGSQNIEDIKEWRDEANRVIAQRDKEGTLDLIRKSWR